MKNRNSTKFEKKLCGPKNVCQKGKSNMKETETQKNWHRKEIFRQDKTKIW